MNLKTPFLKRDQLEAVKRLLRINFGRAVAYRLQANEKAENPAPAPETAALIVHLLDELTRVDQPLTVAMAILDMQGLAGVYLPMSDELFDYYEKILAETDISPETFPGINPEVAKGMLDPLKVSVTETQKAFADAGFMTRAEMKRSQGTGLSGSIAKGVLN